jgi:hypothetical protein
MYRYEQLKEVKSITVVKPDEDPAQATVVSRVEEGQGGGRPFHQLQVKHQA